MGGVRIDAPPWLDELPEPDLGPHATDEARMAWVADLVDRQVEERTGGPFAAAVFDGDGRLLAAAVNRVEPTNSCIAHAEVLALAEAGQAVGSFTLGERDAVLVNSAEPCAMCLGALGWSGIERLVCGATDHDARGIGFDEGDKPDHWVAALDARGISVARGVLRERVRAAMQRYVDRGGTIYNAGPDSVG